MGQGTDTEGLEWWWYVWFRVGLGLRFGVGFGPVVVVGVEFENKHVIDVRRGPHKNAHSPQRRKEEELQAWFGLGIDYQVGFGGGLGLLWSLMGSMYLYHHYPDPKRCVH